MSQFDVTIVGGGVVGCAIASVCAHLGLSTVLLEKESGLGRGTTSRNSEVSHGGMYYPTGSLKARFCVQGRRQLKEFCARAQVGYRECGKLIVAVEPGEIPELERLLALGNENGVEDLELLQQDQVLTLEPEIRAVAALWSPRTGLVDAEAVAKAYARSAVEAGAQVMASALVEGLDKAGEGWRVSVSTSGDGRREGWSHKSSFVVNAAGLSADLVAALAGVDIQDRGWTLQAVKGNYFRIDARHAGRIDRLVYPVPPQDHSSLGVHLCVDLAGQLRLGPDVDLTRADKGVDPEATLPYHVDSQRCAGFFEGASRFLPWLEPGDLSPDMSGYRPKREPLGFQDFVVQMEDGPLNGMINLIGIDSPGLTSAPALARQVGRLLTG